MSRKIRLDLQYVGTAYAGWQTQPGLPTIQGSIEGALAQILQTPVRVHGSGRTDAGVHARGQVAHFETGSSLPFERILQGTNHFLPWDIRIVRISEVPADFHARRSAISKEYRYRLFRGEVMLPHLHPLAVLCRGALDLAAMHEAAAHLAGTHDFASLRSAGSATETTVRTVLASEWIEDGAELIYRIEADGFLYKMVRTIVGGLLEVGRGQRSPASVGGMLGGRDRSLAGPVVSSRGLHLWCVRYADKLA